MSFVLADVVVLVAVVILVGLFSMQHYGTDKVGWLFAPVVLLWFLLIGGIGIFNIWKYDSSVLKAFSPVYIFRYFSRLHKAGWISLGGIMLSITGSYHFSLSFKFIMVSFWNRVSSVSKKCCRNGGTLCRFGSFSSFSCTTCFHSCSISLSSLSLFWTGSLPHEK